MEKLVTGILHGALNAKGFTDIYACIEDAEHVFTDAETAYEDFKAGGASKALDGLKALADLFKYVEAGMKDCKANHATTPHWDKMKKMASVFENPKDFLYDGKDFIVNGHDILSKLNTAVSDYENEDWEDFGYQCGKAAAAAIIDPEEEHTTPELRKLQVA